MSVDQVAGFIFRESPVEPGASEYLALHRAPSRGDFWQCVTGGIEATDSTPADAIYREVVEELDLTATEVVDVGYSFAFQNSRGKVGTEHVFGVRVDTAAAPKLQDEHDARLWVPYAGMRQLIANTWPENTVGLDYVHAWVRGALPFAPRRAFDEHNYSVVTIMPAAREQDLAGEILERLYDRGLNVVASIGAVQLDAAGIDTLWQKPHARIPQHEIVRDVTISGPADVHLVEGPNASRHARAVKNELRAKHANGASPTEQCAESTMYCSRRMEELARQAITFFGAVQLNQVIENRLYIVT